MGGRAHGVSDLDRQLLQAHENGDGATLARLYATAADSQNPGSDQAAFYLTHAYVFALEEGMAEAAEYHQQLKFMGKEE